MSETGRKALFPASFDPLTNGHLDIALRAANLFDEVILAVAVNVAKTGTFSLEDRLEMVESAVAENPGIRVTTFEVDLGKCKIGFCESRVVTSVVDELPECTLCRFW